MEHPWGRLGALLEPSRGCREPSNAVSEGPNELHQRARKPAKLGFPGRRKPQAPGANLGGPREWCQANATGAMGDTPKWGPGAFCVASCFVLCAYGVLLLGPFGVTRPFEVLSL